MNLDFFSAFVIGLLGSGHCVVMCGGISTMLTTAISDSAHNKNIVLYLPTTLAVLPPIV